MRELFLLCFFQRVVVPVCVVLCGSWSCGCRSHWNGCMNDAWVIFWGGSRSTKTCVFRVKWLQPAKKGTSSVRRVGLGRFIVRPMCFATSCCSCVRSPMRFLNFWLHDRIGMAEWMLHGFCFGKKAWARNFVFFRAKWLQPAKKGTSSVRLGSFHARIVPPTFFPTSGCSCVRSSMRFLKLRMQSMNVAWVFWSGSRSKNLVFFRVKWLQKAKKGTSFVRQLRLRSVCLFSCRSVMWLQAFLGLLVCA